MFSSINLDCLALKVYTFLSNSELMDRPILGVRLWEEAQLCVWLQNWWTGVEEMPNWGTEDWQNVNLLVKKRLKMKGFLTVMPWPKRGLLWQVCWDCLGLQFSLSTLCGLYVVIVWNSNRMRIVSFYQDCFLVLFISCFFPFHLNLSYCPPPKWNKMGIGGKLSW